MDAPTVKQTLSHALAPLASLPYQRRYIVRGTKDAFVIPNEVLESVHSNLDRFDKFPQYAGMTEVEKSSVRKFGVYFRNMASKAPSDAPGVSSRELVEWNPVWTGLRQAAVDCLVALGFDLDSWEKEQLPPETENDGRKWRYMGRNSGGAETYEIYRIPNNGKPFREQDPSKCPERLYRDGSWRHEPGDDVLWREELTGEFHEGSDEISEEEVSRLRQLWEKKGWPGR